MADTKPPSNWSVELLKGLPASLLFILTVDWVLLKDLVDLYKFQVGASDPNKDYVLISIAILVLVNLIIISSFARVRFLLEKQAIRKSKPVTIKE